MNSLIISLAASAVVLTGCVNPDGTQNNTGSGALIGGSLGALTGAAIGGHRHGGEDALLGAAAGAVAGGLIGNSADREQEARLKAQAPQTYTRVDQGQPLGLADVKALAVAKISDDIIISQISSSHTVYHLSAVDIIDLRNAGVSDKVINFMINTQNSTEVAPQTSTVVVAEPPPVAPVETIVVAPAPGYVWIGGEWVWNGRWVWSAGHWGYPPYPGAIWIGGSWGHGGRGWHRAPGHWR